MVIEMTLVYHALKKVSDAYFCYDIIAVLMEFGRLVHKKF